jgi:hypothetical protein
MKREIFWLFDGMFAAVTQIAQTYYFPIELAMLRSSIVVCDVQNMPLRAAGVVD